MIKNNLKASKDKQKSYAKRNKLFKEFQVGEQVYLCVKPKKISLRISLCAKLTPRFCGTFKILKRIGTIAYLLAPPLRVKFRDVFHVSFLKKYVKDVDHEMIEKSIL